MRLKTPPKLLQIALFATIICCSFSTIKADKTIYATVGKPFTFSPWSDVEKPSNWAPLVCVSTNYTVYSADQNEAPLAFSINAITKTPTEYGGYKDGYYSTYEATPLMEGIFNIVGSVTMWGCEPFASGGGVYGYRTNYITYHIIVTPPKEVKSITIPSSLTLNIGDLYTFDPIIYEAGAETTLTWYSSDNTVATIDNLGNLLALKGGASTITCVAANGVSATCAVTVNPPKEVKSITIPSTLTLNIGDTYTFNPIIHEAGAETTLTWLNSDNTVASIDNAGNLKALKWGNATITCVAANGVSASCFVTVNPNMVSSIALNYTSYNIEATDKFTLKASVSPADATNKEVEWSSSDFSIARVNQNGVVTGVATGTCEISATAKDGSGVSATCRVQVYKSTSPFNFTLNASSKEATMISATDKYSGDIQVPSQVVRNNVIYTVTAIGDNCFSACSDLTNVTIPNSIASIGSRAFENCSSLKTVTISNKNCSIGERSFYGCSSIVSFVLPSSITIIPNRCFQGCSSLKQVTLGDNVNAIDYRAFQGCSSLTEINLPTTLTNVGYRAFQDCTSLKSVSLPNVKRLSDAAFSDESYAFAGCTSLERISIPNVEFVGTAALTGCKKLAIIEINTATPPAVNNPFPDIWHSKKSSNGTGIDADACELVVPVNSISDYRKADGWKEFSNMILLGSRLKRIEKPNRYDFRPESAALAAGSDGVVSYRNRVVRNVLYTIRGNAYNAVQQCLQIGRVMTADSIAVLNSFIIPEMSGYQQRFNGVTMLLAAGSGTLTIDSESAGSHALAVKIGNDEQQTFTLGSRKTSVINYSIASDSYAYIYATPAASASSNIAPKRTLATANDSLKIYSIEVVPGNVIATGSVPQPAVTSPASDITETSFVANWDNTEAASFDLYVYKNGPTALQEAFDGNTATAASLAAAGWEMTKGFVEEDALRLGTSSVAGDVTTPALGISGGAVMSFDIKAYANDKDLGKTLDISVVGTGSVNTNTVTTTADYSRYTLLLNGLAANSRVKIAAHEAANNRFLIDNIIVAESGLGSMGTATAYSENFNSATIATLESAGWQLTKGACDESALRLGTSSVGGEAVTPALGVNGKATLSFKTKAYANSKDLGKMLDISVIGSGDIDGNFVTTSAEYVTYTFELSGLDTTSRVKIASHDDANNRFYLDNVKVAYHNVGEAPLEGYPVNTAEYSHEVTGLEPGSSYSYYVIAKNEIGDEADMSNIQIVSTLPGAAAAAAGDINGDASVDGNDVSILLEMVLAGGVNAEQMPVADINGDNSVDGNDVSILLEMVLSGN